MTTTTVRETLEQASPAPNPSPSANRAPDKLTFGTLLAWTSRIISTSMNYIVLGFLTIYCSDILGLNVGVVGTLMLVTKIFDAVLSIPIGYIVDRTNTRWGRGRPYEWGIIGVWVATILMFATPNGWGDTVKYIWVFVMYVMNQGVFGAFLGAGTNPYMVRAFNNEKLYIKFGSYGGLLSAMGALLVNVLFPIMMAKLGTSHQGWIVMMLIIGVPAMVIGIMRFFFIPERYDVDVTTDKVDVKAVLDVLKANKYIWPVTIMTLINAMVANMGIQVYYYTYVVGNVSLMSAATAIGGIMMPALLVMPMILRKLSINQACFWGFVMCILGYATNWFAGANFVMLMCAAVFFGLGQVPINMFGTLMALECAEYNEYIGKPRMEATLGVISGLGGTIGGAFGAFILGQLLNLGGYVSSAGNSAAQPDSAILMIRLLFSFIPAALYLIAALASKLYGLDKRLPEIRKANEERRAAAEARLAEPHAGAKAADTPVADESDDELTARELAQVAANLSSIPETEQVADDERVTGPKEAAAPTETAA
ncbi:MFS transporter [Bifidobacterium sp. SO4]|uniref:MFS transporter n=1 Tax=Bifidobacterium sp. SO4 TaxID=2809030 RepID=UPI001BDD076F|nr:MFS transporter [Bifidobacterium sp. SO4]MBT1171554.1 MFS transporter [Bifidobacterium sp. SO4]